MKVRRSPAVWLCVVGVLLRVLSAEEPSVPPFRDGKTNLLVYLDAGGRGPLDGA